MSFDYDRRMGRQIKALREARGLSQEQLAARLQTHGCDLTRSALAKIEAGQGHLYSFEIKALKIILDVSYETLFV